MAVTPSIPNSALAQDAAALTTRARFLAAPAAAVRRELRVSPLDSAQSVDRVLADLLPAIKEVYGIEADVGWDNTTTGGSSAHPELGVTLNRPQIVALRARLDEGGFVDVLRYVVAHELAHMLQYRHYSAEAIADTTKTRPIECEADLFAGMATAEIFTQLQVPIPEQNRRNKVTLATAFEIGYPAWDDPTQHPTPMQRLLCAASGQNAGLQYRWIRQYRATKDTMVARFIKDNVAFDPNMAGLEGDLFKWTNETAKGLVGFEGRQSEAFGGPVDIAGAYRRLASAAERGPEAMRRNQQHLPLPGPLDCGLTESPGQATFTCSDRFSYVSKNVAHATMDSRIAFVSSLLGAVGWKQVFASTFDARFAYERASAIIHLDEQLLRITTSFTGRDPED